MLHASDPTAALLASVREARFSHGLRCPRCGSAACIRWGSFRGRLRYRCRDCRRTFNDLTGTPFAYTKRLAYWAPYAAAMARSDTVRHAAKRVGIHPSTAFRWRHRLLAALRDQDREELRGWIELGSAWFAYSEKGRTPAGHPPRRRGLDEIFARTDYGVNVLLACDRSGGVVTGVIGRTNRRRVSADDLEVALTGRLARDVTLLAADGWFGGPSIFADRLGRPFIDTRPRRRGASPLAHVRATFIYNVRLMAWIERFRGVATRYLRNHLLWHRLLDRQYRLGFALLAFQWPLD